MGLDISIHGYRENKLTAFHCKYSDFSIFRQKLVEAAYGEKMADIYYQMFHDFFLGKRDTFATTEEADYWHSHCNDDLELLIWHSDCDGKLTPTQCRKIYNAVKDLHIDMAWYKAGVGEVNFLDEWKDMLLYCTKHRVNMYFT